MVRLKFITKDGKIVFRISGAQERFYKRVSHLLKGTPNIDKHWKSEKEKFSSYSPFYSENNKILEDFKAPYVKIVNEHPELTPRQVADFFKTETKLEKSVNLILSPYNASEYCNSVSKFLEVVILRERAKQGCNYESYYKLLCRCRKSVPGFNYLAFSSLDFNTMLMIANSFAKSKGYRNTAKTFRAFLGRAHKDQNVNFRLSQIGDFCFSDYNPEKYDEDNRMPDILNEEQLNKFLNLNLTYITPNYKDRFKVELYYNFCVFMFHSFFAPCDVIKLKTGDITNRNTLLIKRKKTHRSVEVPITPAMKKIIIRYKGMSEEGYVFPIMSKEKEAQHITKDYIFKKFREALNCWLKELGREIGVDYNLYAYVFRHTAITYAINNGLPIAFVSSAAGTSVEMIQKHYYNGESAQNRKTLSDVFMQAGNR